MRYGFTIQKRGTLSWVLVEFNPPALGGRESHNSDHHDSSGNQVGFIVERVAQSTDTAQYIQAEVEEV